MNVVVLGGGPAGAATAITCAQAGVSVMLLERQSFPRERPGETLHPGIEPLLHKLGVAEAVLAAGFLRHRGHWVQWGDQPRFMPFGSDEQGEWLGFQAGRAELDSLLLEGARSHNIPIQQPCRAMGIRIEHGRVMGVETASGFIAATYVVDATGGQHWLAKQLGLQITHYSPPLTAYYGYAEGNCPLRDQAPAMVADAQGWIWTARVHPQLYQWTRLLFDPSPLPQNWRPDEFQSLTPRGKPRRADVTWRMASQVAGPGYFLTGDAAAVLDPASSHGVLKAILSGMMTGHLISQIDRGQSERFALQTYQSWLPEQFRHDLNTLQALYALKPL
jgi:2-polyprenyl-6-methoxyphenol hydroxylase-like FAD-dependent oxidoreductase